jgi:ABC-type lipoprotein export system ATPase subunit
MANQMSEVLVAENIVRSFPMGKERLVVLKGANLSVKEGEMLAVMGASGAGKSTLLHILGALDHPVRLSILSSAGGLQPSRQRFVSRPDWQKALAKAERSHRYKGHRVA